MFRLTITDDESSKPAVPASPGAEDADTIRGLPNEGGFGSLSREGRRLSRAAVLESMRLAPRIPRQHADLADRVCDTLLASYTRFAHASRQPRDAEQNFQDAKVFLLDAVAALAPLLRARRVPREAAGRLFVLVEQLVRLSEGTQR